MHRGRRKGKTAIRNSTSRGLGPISIDPNALAACSACLPTAARPAAPLRFSHLSPRGRQFLHLENFDVTSEVGVLLGEVGIDIEHCSVVVAPMTPSRSCSISATQAPSPTGRFTFTTDRLWPKDANLLRSACSGRLLFDAAGAKVHER